MAAGRDRAFGAAQVRAYRAVAQGLARDGSTGYLDLGVRDTPPGSAALAVATRAGEVTDLPDTVTVWSVRGAPHLHRAADITALTRGLWPATERAARASMSWTAKNVDALGMSAVDAVTTVATSLARFRDTDHGRGELSSLVTEDVPRSLSVDCERCGSRHVHEQLFRVGALPAGVRLVESSPVTLSALERWDGVPTEPGNPTELLRAYLHLHGPATPDDAAAYFAVGTPTATEFWPTDAESVTVDGRDASILPEDMDALRAADAPDGVRLLPPGDPFFGGRDRDVLVPDAADRKSLWRAVASPGALLVGADVAGTWRARGTRRLTVTVHPFSRVRASDRRQVDAEAELVAGVRGAGSVDVVWDQ